MCSREHEAVLDLFALGAAALGLWTVVRYPALGPSSFTSGILLLGGALALLGVGGAIVGAAAATLGPAASLVLVVLPTLTAVFWAAGCFFRLLLSAAR